MVSQRSLVQDENPADNIYFLSRSASKFKPEISMSLKKRNKKILIVDDENFNIVALRALIDLVTNCSASVDFAMNGNKAMDLIKENCNHHDYKYIDYHLIITDLRMKPVDGYQLSQNVRNYLIDCKLNQPLIALCTGDNSQMD
jgi:CheY-like chemotaxis protein